MSGEYDALMAELDDVMAKAQPVQADPDAAIAAAADGKDMPGAGDKDDEDDEDGETFMKSFQVTLEDGTTQDAYDATAMLKAMHATARRQATTVQVLEARLAEQDGVIRKLPALLKAMGDRMAEQGEALRALREAPGGRRTVSHAPAAAAPAAMNRGEVMAKCLTAVKSGALTPLDAAMAEARLNDGLPLPQHITAAIAAA